MWTHEEVNKEARRLFDPTYENGNEPGDSYDVNRSHNEGSVNSDLSDVAESS